MYKHGRLYSELWKENGFKSVAENSKIKPTNVLPLPL